MVIRPALPADLPALKLLFREYATSVGNEICFQAFEAEVAALPGVYAPPAGEILLATTGLDLAGSAALRPLEDRICEMKRLYIRPAFRGTGLGRSLTQQIIAAGLARRYCALRLDTLPAMQSAIALYRSLGFREIPPYGANPPSALCFELLLNSVND
jgi:putative acetyltransferase